MTYALDGGRLTWNVAVPWAAADLDQLQNRRYITDGGDAKVDPRGKLDRSVNQGLLEQNAGLLRGRSWGKAGTVTPPILRMRHTTGPYWWSTTACVAYPTAND